MKLTSFALDNGTADIFRNTLIRKHRETIQHEFFSRSHHTVAITELRAMANETHLQPTYKCHTILYRGKHFKMRKQC